MKKFNTGANEKLWRFDFESPLPHKLKPVSDAGFRFLKQNSVTLVSDVYSLYSPPEIVKGKRWYIKYYFNIPEELQPLYNNRKRHRFHNPVLSGFENKKRK